MSDVMILDEVREELQKCADPKRAEIAKRYFRAYPGGYGQGDVFLGINMPTLRSLSKKFSVIGLPEVLDFLHSAIHEERMLALLILVSRFQKSVPSGKKEIFDMYIRNMRFINNWDLVDLSAPQIVGGYLLGRDKNLLYELAGSDDLWERRISILSTFCFIRENNFDHTFNIARVLIPDKEDLIHKAAGWMLREVGKRDMDKECLFLSEHYRKMPRTMLRYAIERFPEKLRKDYLEGRI